MPGFEHRRELTAFDLVIDSDMLLPLTLEEALEDPSLFHFAQELRCAKSQRSLRHLVAPPPTPSDGFEFGRGYVSRDMVRGESFSSDSSTPSMVEDHSGVSDSEDDHHQESAARIWNTHHIPTTLPQQAVTRKHCHPPIFNFIPTVRPEPGSRQHLPRQVTGSQSELDIQPLNRPIARKIVPISDSTAVASPTSLHRSHAQRSGHRAPNVLKSLPPAPPNETKTPQIPLPALPIRQKPPQQDLQHHLYRYIPIPQNAQPFSFHNTPPLPHPVCSPAEKSVFEYDSDNESHFGRHRAQQRSPLCSSLATKLHIRSKSSGTKGPGLVGKRDRNKDNTNGFGEIEGHKKRRRSATEIVMGVFGLAKS